MHTVRACLITSIRSLVSRKPNIHLISRQQQSIQARTITMSPGPTYTSDYLKEKLLKDLEAEHVEMEDLSNCGCGMKFDAVIVSPKFEGKPILQRQRLVNQILAEEMKHIHALTMCTLTPSQWKEKTARENNIKN